jgi:hypothetical protein
MVDEFKPGDRVEWRSSGGRSVGHVVRKLTEPCEIGDHDVKASPENPEYLVESEKTGKQAAHKPTALKRVKE